MNLIPQERVHIEASVLHIRKEAVEVTNRDQILVALVLREKNATFSVSRGLPGQRSKACC